MMYIIQWTHFTFEDLGNISVFMCSLKSPSDIRTEIGVFLFIHLTCTAHFDLYALKRTVLQENHIRINSHQPNCYALKPSAIPKNAGFTAKFYKSPSLQRSPQKIFMHHSLHPKGKPLLDP